MADNKAKRPLERMSRKQPKDSWPGRRFENPKECYSAVQLEEVGAVTLIWNQVEAFLDWLVSVSWLANMQYVNFWEITDRISAIDKKLDLLRLYATQSQILDDDARDAIKITLDGVAEYRKHRDNVVHSFPFDIDRGIAHRRNRRAEAVQTLMTYEALHAVFVRLQFLLNELREVDMLYRLADERGAFKVYGDKGFDPRERRRTRDVPIQTARVRQSQKDRLSLPPLPEIPAGSVVPPWKAGPERQRRSEETL